MRNRSRADGQVTFHNKIKGCCWDVVGMIANWSKDVVADCGNPEMVIGHFNAI